jgi:hypothetical protein
MREYKVGSKYSKDDDRGLAAVPKPAGIGMEPTGLEPAASRVISPGALPTELRP